MPDDARPPSRSEQSGIARMENEGGHAPAPGGQSAELARHGIVCVPATISEWGGYRYTNAHDALAAARRGTSK